MAPIRTETPVNCFVNCQTLNVNCLAVNHVPFVARQPQMKVIRPFVKAIKSLEGVSCVHQLSSVKPVTNVHIVAQNLPAGARLN